MQNRTLIIFGCALLALIVIYALQQRSEHIEVMETGVETILPDLDTSEVDKIRLLGPGGDPRLVVEKAGDEWTVPSYFNARADMRQVHRLFSDLEGLQGELRVSEGKLFSVFDIGDDEAFKLELVNGGGKELLSLLLGKRGPQGRGSFVRFKGEPEVYLAQKNLLATLGIFDPEEDDMDVKRWADLDVVAPPKDKWTRVRLSGPDGSVVWAKELRASQDNGRDNATGTQPQDMQTVWVQKEPLEPALKDDGIQSVLGALDRLRGTRLVDPENLKEYGLEHAANRIVITLEGEETVELLAGRPQKDGTAYAKIKQEALVYEIPSGSFEALFKPEESKED